MVVAREQGLDLCETPSRSQPSLQPLLPVRQNKLNLSSFSGSLRLLNSVLAAPLIKAVTANLLNRGWGFGWGWGWWGLRAGRACR